MDTVKKNLVSIIFGVVALVAIVAAFFPMSGKFEDLNAQLEARKKKYDEAKGLLSKNRDLPVVSLDVQQREPLGVFPMPTLTKMAQAYMKSLVDQSEEVFKLAVDMNRKECRLSATNQLLLLPDVLPNPNGSKDSEFRNRLAPAVMSLRDKVLVGGMPPTPEEITKEDAGLQAQYNTKLIKGPDGQPINQDKVTEEYQKEAVLLPDKLRNDRAVAYKMYVDPTALTAPPEIVTGAQLPTPSQIWYAQVALWVQEDVCRALAEVNKESRNVLDAPVKRLVKLDVRFGPDMYARPGAVVGGSEGAVSGRGEFAGSGDASAAGQPSGPPQRNYGYSPTGRTSNSMYDVVNFQLELHVDISRLPQVLKQLSFNRFITVRKIDAKRLEPLDLKSNGFIYGGAPAVDLVLDCEMLQLREWTALLMPNAVRATLGVPADFQPTLSAKKPQ